MNVDFFETVTVTLEATTLLFDTATVTKPGNSVALKNVTLDLRVFLIYSIFCNGRITSSWSRGDCC